MGFLELYVACMAFGGVFVLLSVFSGLGEGDADLEAEADADLDAELEADLDADADADVDADGDFDAEMDADLDGFDPEADLDGVDAEAGTVDVEAVPFEFDLEGAGIDAAENSGGSVDVETGPRRSFNPLVSFKFWTFGLAFFGLTGFLFEQFGVWNSSLGVLVVSVAMGLFAGLSVSYGLRAVDQSESNTLSERDYLGATAEVLLPIEEDRVGKIRMEIEGRTIDRRATSFEEGVSFETGEQCFVLGFGDDGLQVVDVETVRRQVVAEEESRTLAEFDEELSNEHSNDRQVSENNARIEEPK